MATIMHEFTHAMGVMHTQSRPDRDEHIVIHWENIPVNRWNNFAKVEGNAWTTFDMPYNHMSVMHYSGYGFSTNGEYTIETIDPFYQGMRHAIFKNFQEHIICSISVSFQVDQLNCD